MFFFGVVCIHFSWKIIHVINELPLKKDEKMAKEMLLKVNKWNKYIKNPFLIYFAKQQCQQ